MGHGEREGLDRDQRAERQIGDRDRGQDATDQGADDAGVTPLPGEAVAGPHHHRDGEQDPIAALCAAERLGDHRAGHHRQRQSHGITQHRRIAPEMPAERAEGIGSLGNKGGQVDVADRRQRRPVIRQRRLEAADVAERLNQPRRRGVDRLARRRG